MQKYFMLNQLLSQKLFCKGLFISFIYCIGGVLIYCWDFLILSIFKRNISTTS